MSDKENFKDIPVLIRVVDGLGPYAVLFPTEPSDIFGKTKFYSETHGLANCLPQLFMEKAKLLDDEKLRERAMILAQEHFEMPLRLVSNIDKAVQAQYYHNLNLLRKVRL